jgi:biotin carboxyl carrier protein
MENKEENSKLIAVGSNNTKYNFDMRNNYEYSLKSKRLKVEIIEEADGFTILSANGLRYPVEIVSRHQNAYEVLVNGVSYTFTVETPFSLQRKKVLENSNQGNKKVTITAPMPGKILEIMVKEDQEILPGETLLILEAMKMQNSITAHEKCVVKKIVVKPGTSVGKGDLLIEMERV